MAGRQNEESDRVSRMSRICTGRENKERDIIRKTAGIENKESDRMSRMAGRRNEESDRMSTE